MKNFEDTQLITSTLTFSFVGILNFVLLYVIQFFIIKYIGSPLLQVLIIVIYLKAFDSLVINKIPLKSSKFNTIKFKYKVSYLSTLLCFIIYFLISVVK